MNPIRITGLTCLAAAVVLLVLDVSLGLIHANWQTISIAHLWSKMSPGGLVSMQSFVQGQISSFLWNGILLPIISLPVWLTLAILGVILVAAGRSSAD